VLQQKPSTQLPVAHARQVPEALQSVARLQLAPWVFWATHEPAALQ
jgi:hypothetical protein